MPWLVKMLSLLFFFLFFISDICIICLKSPVTQSFVQDFFLTNSEKKNIVAPYHRPFVRGNPVVLPLGSQRANNVESVSMSWHVKLCQGCKDMALFICVLVYASFFLFDQVVLFCIMFKTMWANSQCLLWLLVRLPCGCVWQSRHGPPWVMETPFHVKCHSLPSADHKSCIAAFYGNINYPSWM